MLNKPIEYETPDTSIPRIVMHRFDGLGFRLPRYCANNYSRFAYCVDICFYFFLDRASSYALRILSAWWQLDDTTFAQPVTSYVFGLGSKCRHRPLDTYSTKVLQKYQYNSIVKLCKIYLPPPSSILTTPPQRVRLVFIIFFTFDAMISV